MRPMTPQEEEKLEGFLKSVAAQAPLKKEPSGSTDAIMGRVLSPARGLRDGSLVRHWGSLAAVASACLIMGAVAGGWWMHRQSRSLVPVQFSLAASRAEAVALAGDFTDWQMVPLERRGGAWVADLKVPKGRFQYAFILNDRVLVVDPNARDFVTDSRGRTYSVLDTRKRDSI